VNQRRRGFELQTREQMMQQRKHTADEDGTPLVVLPTESEVGQAISTGRLCMFCKHWDLELGQEECRRQKFWQRMLNDEKYRPEWFEDPRTYGLCKAWDGRLVPSIAPATCVKSDLDSDLYHQPGGMDKLPCPHFWDKRVHGSGMVIGAHSKTKLEH
jgi:hypothetical protein